MRGIRTASPSKGPVKIVASITFSIVFFFFLRQVACHCKALVGLCYVIILLLVRLFLFVARVVETLKDPRNLKIQMDN